MKPQKKNVTILDIANAVGVSPSTVTHSLNGKRPVKAETREKVKKAIAELGYVPSWNASKLKGHSGRIIGCIATDISESFVNQIVRGIEQGLIAGEETLLFVSLIEFAGNFEEAHKFLLSHDIDGLLICYHIPHGESLKFNDNIPVVSLNMDFPEHVSVLVNGESGGAMAADHLFACGMRKSAIICGPEKRISVEARLSGFMKRIKDLGLELPENPYYGEYDADHGYNACREMLDKGISFDGLFAENDYIAAGAINALNEKGLRVPEDVKVAGFDNRDFSAFWNPPITTFQQPLMQIGFMGMGLLRNMTMNGGIAERRCVLESQLIARKSTMGKN